MRKKNIFLLFTVYCLLFTNLYSAFNDPGWSARSEGMGGLGVTKGFDSTVIFYNPAGLIDLLNKEVNFMLLKPYVGLNGVNWNYYEFSAGIPLSKISLGIGMGMFDADSLYKETSIFISGAKELNKIKIGSSIKMLSHAYSFENLSSVYGSSSKSAFTLSIGSVYEIKDGLNVGLSLDNILPADVGLETEDKVPMLIRFGVSKYKENFWKLEDFLAGVEFVNRCVFSYRFGIESWFFGHTLGVRIGLNDTSFNTGLSYNFVLSGIELQMDYAFSLPLNIKETSTNHRIQIGVRFGGNESIYEEESAEMPEEVEEVGTEEEVLNEEPKDKKREKLKKKYFKKATEYFMDGEYEKAIKYWKKVLEIDPNHEISKKKIEKAKKLLQEEQFYEE